MPIVFSQPIQFAEAAQRRQIQTVLPTSLTSAELSQISSDILERALFSARVSDAGMLQKLGTLIDRYIAGEVDLATARLEMKQFLNSIGYQAQPQDEGTIKDLATDERINLQLEMNASSAYGYGDWLQHQQQPILDRWPCQELLRVGFRRTHRQWSGLDDQNIIEGEPVEGRWADAGGQLYDGRMIALVNDPIWTVINRFGVPYPPFDFNSGMGVQAIDRDEALSLGVITEETPRQTPQTRDFNQNLKFTTAIRDAALRQALEEWGYTFVGDVLTP